jgi:hypothetical protein
MLMAAAHIDTSVTLAQRFPSGFGDQLCVLK